MTELTTIKGTTYKVIYSATPDEQDAKGLHNLAAINRKYDITREVGLQRPNGRVMWIAHQYDNGTFGELTRIG